MSELYLDNASLIANTSFIDGTNIYLPHGDHFDVTNPANGDTLAEMGDSTAAEAELAIVAAAAAQPAWAARSCKQRAARLRQWHGLIMDNLEDLAQLLTAEQGKPINEARGEIRYGASYIEWFAEQAKRANGEVIPGPDADKRVLAIRQPVGVVTAVTPWNFPMAMIARKVAPALAAGCTFVVKPASETPLSALALASLASEAGIPDGVFNVVVGTDAQGIGEVLTKDPRVAKFTFTGSTSVGKKLLAQCAGTVKNTSMELGGNAPFIVFDDADLDDAVEGAVASKFRNAGQTCICANRFFVQESVMEAFTEKIVSATRALRVGEGTSEKVDIGPLINAEALKKVERLVASACDAGARCLTGGGRHDHDGGAFFEPTVLADVTPDMDIVHEEIFGPVVTLIPFRDEAHAIELANDTRVGLAAYFYSRDIGRVWRVAEALKAGMVGINEGAISNEMAPFGGVGESGYGREGSVLGLEDYQEVKYLCMGGLNA